MANVAEYGKDTLAKTANALKIGIEATEKLTKALLILIEELAKTQFTDALKEHVVEGHELEFNAWDSTLYEDLDDRLNEKGVPHVIIQDSTSGIVYFVTRDSDHDIVRDVKNQVLEEEKRISRVSTQDLYRMNAKSNVASFSDLSETQVKLFQEEAKKRNFVMAAQQQEDGSYKVFFGEKNAEKAKQALNDVVIKSNGISGQIIENQKKTNLENMQKINEQLKDTSKDFYIVSSTNINEFIHISKSDFQYMRNNNLINLEQRDDSNFVKDVHYQASSLINPVVFSKDEYEQFKSLISKVSQETGVNEIQASSKIMNTINSTYKGNVKEFFEAEKRGDITYSTKETNDIKRLVIKDKNYSPELSPEKLRQLQLENKIRELISAKMSLDNGNQNKIFSSLYNNEVSFSEFFAYEVANDQYDVDKNKELYEAAKEIDTLPEEDKTYLRNFIKEIYDDRNEHHYGSEYVDPAKLSRENLDDFINAHDGFGDNIRDEYERDDNEFDK